MFNETKYMQHLCRECNICRFSLNQNIITEICEYFSGYLQKIFLHMQLYFCYNNFVRKPYLCNYVLVLPNNNSQCFIIQIKISSFAKALTYNTTFPRYHNEKLRFILDYYFADHFVQRYHERYVNGFRIFSHMCCINDNFQLLREHLTLDYQK